MKINAQHFKLHLKHQSRAFGLKEIGPIEAIQTIRAHDALLCQEHSALLHVFQIELHVDDVILHSVDQGVDFLEPLSTALLVEVEILILDYVLDVLFIVLDVRLEGGSNHLFRFLVFRHQIHADDSCIALSDQFAMFQKGLVGQVVGTRDLRLGREAPLFPEAGHGTANLQKGNAKLADVDDLLGLDEVRHTASVIHPAGIVSSACPFARPARDQIKA